MKLHYLALAFITFLGTTTAQVSTSGLVGCAVCLPRLKCLDQCISLTSPHRPNVPMMLCRKAATRSMPSVSAPISRSSRRCPAVCPRAAPRIARIVSAPLSELWNILLRFLDLGALDFARKLCGGVGVHDLPDHASCDGSSSGGSTSTASSASETSSSSSSSSSESSSASSTGSSSSSAASETASADAGALNQGKDSAFAAAAGAVAFALLA